MLKEIKKIKMNKGYTLLFAVLVASLVLIVGVSILTLGKKEFQLSASARDSTSSIYSATGMLECFVYSEDKKGSRGLNDQDFNTDDLICGEDRGLPIITTTSNLNTLTFYAKMGRATPENGIQIQDNSCAKLYVTKTLVGTKWSTIIDSRGYNTGWNSNSKDCSSNSVKKVERALRLAY